MFNSSNTRLILETKIFLFFLIFFCIALQTLSYFTLWTETELFPTHSSQYLFSQYGSEFLFSLKPLFYSILKLSFSFSNMLDLPPMTSSRILFAFNGLAILTLTYFYIKNKTTPYNAVLAVLFLASLNIFLDRGFRVRSDLLSTSLSLICLLINLSIKEQKEAWKFYIIIPLLAVILLISPKGIYWLAFNAVLLWRDMKIKPKAHLGVKTAVFICLSFYLISFIFKDPFFITALNQSFEYYLFNLSETYDFIMKYGLQANLHKLSHISLFIDRNLFLALIISLKFLFIIYSVLLSKSRKKDLSDLYFLILCFITLFHPQQKLFFLAALSPFFCIAFFTDEKWQTIINKYSPIFKNILLAWAFIYAFAHTSYFSYKIYKTKNNLQQKKLIKDLNDFYKDTDLSINILDPNCLIYTRRTNCKYILYNQSLQMEFSSYLEKSSFDIILSSLSLSPSLLSYKQHHFEFINIKNHIYYKAFIINKAHNFIETKKNSSISNADQTAKHTVFKKRTDKPQQALSGAKILKAFKQNKQISGPQQYNNYFYLYIDSLNRPLNKNTACKKNDSVWMAEGCYYSKEQFTKSLIPLTNKRIALFYAPFPFHIQSEKSLRILLRYDNF